MDNYDVLGYSPEDVTRNSRYTRYVGDGRMLRSHMSATIPSALRSLTTPPELLVVAPGICWRRDVVDRTHVGEPHQMDLWRLSGDVLTEADLAEMAHLVVRSVWEDAPVRLVPVEHPYTLRGRQIDVLVDGVWLEVGECGLAHPDVLARCGVTGTGLAMGVGLDRLVMLAKGIDDIRLLRSHRPEVEVQMHDLAPYVPVPVVPSVRRDISVVVPEVLDAELVGDAVRTAAGEDEHLLREVTVLSESAYGELPASAHARMGMRPGQTRPPGG